MSYPRTIRVTLPPIRVVWRDLGEDYGYWDADNWQIVLNTRKREHRRVVLDTLLHEACHVADDISGLSWVADGDVHEARARMNDHLLRPMQEAIRAKFD